MKPDEDGQLFTKYVISCPGNGSLGWRPNFWSKIIHAIIITKFSSAI